MKCSNASRDCKWEGTVDALKKHLLTVCQFTLVPCPKACGCGVMMRKDLQEHLKKDCPKRDHQCRECGASGTYSDITQGHDMICIKKVLACPNDNCYSKIQRRNLKRHLDNCKHTELPCKYQKLGCDMKLKRDALPDHESDEKLHFHLALDKVSAMEDKMQVLENSLKKPITFKVGQFLSKKNSESRFSSPFYTSDGYCMSIKVYPSGRGMQKGTHVSVYIKIKEGKHDAQLKWPFFGDATLTLLNQLEDKNHHTSVLYLSACGKWDTAFIPHSKLGHDPVNNTQFLKDDALYFRVTVDTRSVCRPWLQCTLRDVSLS